MYIFRYKPFIMKRPQTLTLCCTIASCAIIFSCHSASGPAYIPLTATSIYTLDSVRLAATGGDEKAALKLLEQAADLYKKGTDTAKSIEYYKQSILLKPTAKAYYDLAGALVSTRQYAEAIRALRMAEKLGFAPLANVMYRYTLAYSNLSVDANADDTWHDSCLYYMGLAIQMGYSRPQQFLRRELFPGLHSGSGADEIYTEVSAAGSGHDRDRTLWELYKSHYFPIQLPLVIDEKWIGEHQDGNADVSFDFDKFIPAMQNDSWEREPDFSYYYVGLVGETPAWSAMIYSIEPTEQQDTPLVISYYLATYSDKGQVIDTLMVAGMTEASSPFKVFNIQPSLQFSVQDFPLKGDSTTTGANDSTRIRTREALPAATFRIAANGKFEKLEALTLR